MVSLAVVATIKKRLFRKSPTKPKAKIKQENSYIYESSQPSGS